MPQIFARRFAKPGAIITIDNHRRAQRFRWPACGPTGALVGGSLWEPDLHGSVAGDRQSWPAPILDWRNRQNAATHKTMARALTLLLGLATFAWINFAAAGTASEPCKDCSPDKELTVREQIKADRARDAERIAKESAGRPWDGKDLGLAKRTNTSPLVR
jgi:hypothetical protein